MVNKKNDGIKESTDSSTTIEDEDTRGDITQSLLLTLSYFYVHKYTALSFEILLCVQVNFLMTFLCVKKCK